MVALLTGVRGDPARWPALLPRVAHGPLRAALVDAHRADPAARGSAEALLVAMRGAARGDEDTACPPRRRIERGGDGGLRFV